MVWNYIRFRFRQIFHFCVSHPFKLYNTAMTNVSWKWHLFLPWHSKWYTWVGNDQIDDSMHCSSSSSPPWNNFCFRFKCKLNWSIDLVSEKTFSNPLTSHIQTVNQSHWLASEGRRLKLVILLNKSVK